MALISIHPQFCSDVLKKKKKKLLICTNANISAIFAISFNIFAKTALEIAGHGH